MKSEESIWVLGHKINCKVTSGDYDLVTGVTPPSMQGPPPHHHSKYDEVFLVTEGEMEFHIDGKVMKLGPGDSIDIPKNTLHTFGNKTGQITKWINIHSPKGFLSFFQEVGIPEGQTDAQSASLTDEVIQNVMRVSPGFDMHIKL